MNDEHRTPVRQRFAQDTEQTPRQAIIRDQQHALQSPSLTESSGPAPPSLHSSSVSAASVSTADSSRKRRRGDRSPTKTHFALQSLRRAVQLRSVNDISALTQESRVLWVQLRACGVGKGILSDSFPTHSLATLSLCGDFEEQCTQKPLEPIIRSQSLRIEDAQVIVIAARENTNRQRSESAWNCSVHYPILDLARRHYNLSDAVTVEDVTSATISPETLLRSDPSEIFMPSSKIDFVYAWDSERDEPLRQFLQARGLCDINQTYYAPLSNSPVLVNIETKLPGDSWLDAIDQLSSWAYAAQETKSCFLGLAL
ncbi:Hypothetical protein D9617_64g101350 [Elsinoe fawcettii]|nr:Hypothetical protein D9617_64g101350 [Elsinoe fawcettii]